jgi:hypothetical protein
MFQPDEKNTKKEKSINDDLLEKFKEMLDERLGKQEKEKPTPQPKIKFPFGKPRTNQQETKQPIKEAAYDWETDPMVTSEILREHYQEIAELKSQWEDLQTDIDQFTDAQLDMQLERKSYGGFDSYNSKASDKLKF